MRYRDTSLLSVGKFVYVGDDRFRVIHEPRAAEWYLAIKSVSYADQGVYECQVNSKGGSASTKQKSRLVVVGKSSFIIIHTVGVILGFGRIVMAGLEPCVASPPNGSRIIECVGAVAIYRGYKREA